MGAARHLPYATNTQSRAVIKGSRAIAFMAPISVITVAPAVMMARRAAASGVSPGLMRNRAGRTRPNPPRISHTPMKCRNGPGRCTLKLEAEHELRLQYYTSARVINVSSLQTTPHANQK